MLVMFVLANIFLFSISLFFLSFLNLRTKFSFLVGTYLVSFSLLVLSFEVASIFQLLNRSWVIIINFGIGTLGFISWRLNGSPPLFGPFKSSDLARIKNIFSSISSIFLESKELFVLLCFLFVTYGINLLMSIAIQPFNFDVLAYHLSRIIYWYQNQSFIPWFTFDLRQTTYPPNSEIGLLWIFMWVKSDALFWLVQFSAFVVSVLVIAKLAIMLGYDRKRIIFSILIWATLSQVYFQVFSSQNDLVVAALTMCMVVLFFDGVRKKNIGAMVLSALAFGLGMGTKFTFVFFLPAWGVFIILVYWKRPQFRRMIHFWMVFAFIAFIFLGSYFYVQNQLYYGNFFGPSEPVSIVSGRNSVFYRFELLRDNLGRYIYQILEFSPLPDIIRIPIVVTKNNIFSVIYDFVGVSVTSSRTVLDKLFEFEKFSTYVYYGLPEDTAWFGPLFILFVPVLIVRAARTLRYRQYLPLSLIMFFLLYFITQASMQPWTYYKSRYFITPVILVAPFLADLYIETNKIWLAKLGNYFIILLAISSILLGLFVQPARKVPEIRYLLQGKRAPAIWYRIPVYYAVDQYVSEDEILGTYYSSFYSRFVDHAKEESYPSVGDYPLFGPTFHRQVIPLKDLESIPISVNYLLIATVYVEDFGSPHSDFKLIYQDENMSLYKLINLY